MPYSDPERQRAANRAASQRRRLRVAEERQRALESAPDPPDRDELLRPLGVRAREGHVTAARLLLAELRREKTPASDPFAEFDRLANRR